MPESNPARPRRRAHVAGQRRKADTNKRDKVFPGQWKQPVNLRLPLTTPRSRSGGKTLRVCWNIVARAFEWRHAGRLVRGFVICTLKFWRFPPIHPIERLEILN